MKLNKKLLIFLTVIIFITSLFSSEEYINIYSEIITCCSIILGFVITSLTALYTNQKLNMALKHMKQLDNFLEYHQDFIISIVGLIILSFMFQLFPKQLIDITMKGKYILYLHIPILLFIFAMILLYKSVDYVNKFLQLYKNTYSEYIKNKIEPHD